MMRGVWQYLQTRAIRTRLIAGATLVLITFVLAVGAMAEAKILGGQKVVTIAAEIETAFTYAQNWPLGSGLSTLLIGIVGTIVFLTLRKFDPETLLGNKS